MDKFLATKLNTYRGVLCIISKDPKNFATARRGQASIDAMLNFRGPFYPIDKSDAGKKTSSMNELPESRDRTSTAS
jgi:hypothetical protein